MEKSNKIVLNGEEYTIGGTVLTIGLDDDCLPVVCPGVITKWDEENNYMEDEEMRMPIRSKRYDGSILDMSKEYYVASVENYRRLQDICKRERMEQRKAAEKKLCNLA